MLNAMVKLIDSFSNEVEENYDLVIFKPEGLLQLDLSRLKLQAAIVRFLGSSYWEAYLDTLLERSFEIEVCLDNWLRELRLASSSSVLVTAVRLQDASSPVEWPRGNRGHTTSVMASVTPPAQTESVTEPGVATAADEIHDDMVRDLRELQESGLRVMWPS